jgi:ornithine carbamoyltransferase
MGRSAVPRHFLAIDDLSAAEFEAVLDGAAAFERQLEGGERHAVLPERTLGMVFEKPSTRTRVSFETGMTQLGGHAIFLGPDDVGLSEREPLRDTARTLSRYVDCVVARLFDHAALDELAAHAGVPVINGLTDDAHPCQALADLLTIREHAGFDASVAWIGDGNNVARSFALGAARVGLDCTVATPPGYGIGGDVLERAGEIGTAPATTDDPRAAAAGADVVYTDVWVSMGEEEDRERKRAAFEAGGFQVNEALLDPGTAVMHCLPARRGGEITDEILESERSLAFEQAENRLHTGKGLLAVLLGAL